MSHLAIDDLKVVYAGDGGEVQALAGYSLAVPQGAMTVLLGESGCGKTTALNAVAGLLEPAAGRIAIGERVVFQRDGARRKGVRLPPDKRDIGMVFQSYALWPHLTVLENVMYPARRRGASAQDASKAARATLDTVRCGPYADRYPGELSGGQQQRIALARALVSRPKVVLFDEPLSNLDAGLRRGLRDELARLHRELGFTGIYVTHDQAEALALGTDVAVMDRGRIVQHGAPAQVYRRPANEFVARFFGANVLPGVVRAAGRVDTPAGTLPLHDAPPAGDLLVCFMPQAASVQPDPQGRLTVVAAMYVGSHWEVRLAVADCEVLAFHPAALPAPEVGTRAHLRVTEGEVTALQASAAT